MVPRYTNEEAAKALAIYKTETLAQLRKRQRLCREQMETAFKTRNTQVLVNKDIQDALITEAIDYVTFEKPKRKTKV